MSCAGGRCSIAFELPRGDLTARVPSVLEVIYLIFNEGYAATRGDAREQQVLEARAVACRLAARDGGGRS